MATIQVLKSPVEYDVIVTTTEMHTGGEPVRIIESGYPVPQGKTILEKIQYLKERCDNFRKFIMWEPHGHFDMYGALLVAPDNLDADAAVIFLNNQSYATMCGHATIAVVRYIAEKGMLRRPLVSPQTPVKLQTGSGMINASVEVNNHEGVISTGGVGFENVPSFVVKTDLEVRVAGHGIVQVDIVYGGVFFALVTAEDIGVKFDCTPVSEIKRLATEIKESAIPLLNLSHPTTLAYLYGVVVVDSRNKKDPVASTTVCIFADASTDRSPCGTGTTAFVVLLHHRGLLALGQSQIFKNGITGSEFKAWPVKETNVGENKALIVKVEGQAYYSGRSTLMLEKGDQLGRGFLVRN